MFLDRSPISVTIMVSMGGAAAWDTANKKVTKHLVAGQADSFLEES